MATESTQISDDTYMEGDVNFLIPRKHIMVIIFIVGLFVLGVLCGKLIVGQSTNKQYLYVDIEKVMQTIVDHYKEQPFSRKEIITKLENKKLKLNEYLKTLEEQNIVFASPIVIAGAKNITEEVVAKLLQEDEEEKVE